MPARTSGASVSGWLVIRGQRASHTALTVVFDCAEDGRARWCIRGRSNGGAGVCGSPVIAVSDCCCFGGPGLGGIDQVLNAGERRPVGDLADIRQAQRVGLGAGGHVGVGLDVVKTGQAQAVLAHRLLHRRYGGQWPGTSWSSGSWSSQTGSGLGWVMICRVLQACSICSGSSWRVPKRRSSSSLVMANSAKARWPNSWRVRGGDPPRRERRLSVTWPVRSPAAGRSSPAPRWPKPPASPAPP